MLSPRLRAQPSALRLTFFSLLAGMCLALVWVTPVASDTDLAQPVIHVVAPGDTLADVAWKYKVGLAALVKTNDLGNANFIYVGQKLTIPDQFTTNTIPGAGYTVKAGDTLSDISRFLGSDMTSLMTVNGIRDHNRIFVGQVLRIPDGSTGSQTLPTPALEPLQYSVQSGDTLNNLAMRFGVNLWTLARTNSISDINIIRVGQALLIPGARTDRLPARNGPTPERAYVVQAGDTLRRIALNYGMNLLDLVQLNHLQLADIIRVGQTLRIPPIPDPAVGKRIVVDLSDQWVYVYEDGQLLWNWPASTGRRGNNTAPGTYRILDKIPMAYASTWDLQLPFWMGIYWAGPLENGFHGQVINAYGTRIWEGYIGTPITFGCVMLTDENVKILYYWAEIGTPVIVRP